MDLNTYWDQAVPYDQYTSKLKHNAANAPANDPDHYKLNWSRTKRLRKVKPLPEFEDIKHNLRVIAISETWCGDSAQNLPVIANICQALDIPLRIIYRDTNPELMDAFLTNGSRSIPKVIFFNENNGKVVFSWGPRPEPAQDIVQSIGKDYGQPLHLWYAKDRGKTLQNELLQLLKKNSY